MEPHRITYPVDDYIMNDDALKKMYNFFHRFSPGHSSMDDRFHRLEDVFLFNQCLFVAQRMGITDPNTCKDLRDWFGKLFKGESSSEDFFQQFKTLVTTYPRCFARLYEDIFPDSTIAPDFISKEKISLISSDKVVLEMKKSAAKSESGVLRGLVDYIPNAGLDKDHIPVQYSNPVLYKMIKFCHKNHKFNSIIESAVQQVKAALDRLNGTIHEYTTWINGFVKSSKPYFSNLHQAADNLQIPALFELTSMAVGDMKESSVQEISDWYVGLSLQRMLSPLGI